MLFVELSMLPLLISLGIRWGINPNLEGFVLNSIRFLVDLC